MARTAAPASTDRGDGPARAHGRSLGDFGALSPAEETLLECCRRGELAPIGDTCPGEESRANRVRSDFVRFLALGGDAQAPVHEQGVQLHGAWLTGLLDFEAAKAEHPIWLLGCRIERISAADAVLKSFVLDGSRLMQGLLGDRLFCEGKISFCEKFHATGEVRFLGATIKGDLLCTHGRFDNGLDNALSCDSATVTGSVRLDGGFHAIGTVRLIGAAIHRDLNCSGGRFERPGGDALQCDGATIGGTLYLQDRFDAKGEVRLVGATIAGDLACVHGSFDNVGGTALACDLARVARAFYFRDVDRIAGSLVLNSMQVGILCDDVASWKGAAGALFLDGFAYGRITGGARTDAQSRIAWLDSQHPSHLLDGFRPQPWEQLIAVLRALGHPEDARAVAVAKQDRLRRAHKIARGARPLHWLYGLIVGYGYRPMRLVKVVAAVWLFCALAYWWAANPGPFGPSTHLIAARGGTEQAPRPDYRTFVPLIYSADVLLPVVDFGYKDEWQPVVADRSGNPLIWGQLLRFLYWFEIAFGWVAGLLLVGVLGNLIKKD
jgi:hypothetical protein